MAVAEQIRDGEGLRARAVARLEKKREFIAHLMAYVMVNAVLIVVWATTGAGFFWPIFPMMGWGIGIAFHAWDAYGRPPAEERIQREIERLRMP